MHRVLEPGGRLLFAEHGAAPDPTVRAWQDWLTPSWKRLAGGCHLNRKPDALLRNAGFRIDGLETRYVRGWRPFTFMYEGVASIARRGHNSGGLAPPHKPRGTGSTAGNRCTQFVQYPLDRLTGGRIG